MVRSCAFVSVFIVSAFAAAQAQRAPTDPASVLQSISGAKCLQIPAALGKLAAALLPGKCPSSCEGCGCNSGPGYRGPPPPGKDKGQCVSFANINRLCGPPPHAKCRAECTPIIPACLGFGRAWLAANQPAHASQLVLADPSLVQSGSNPPASAPATRTPVAPQPQIEPRTSNSPAISAVEPPSSGAGRPSGFTTTVQFTEGTFRCGEKRLCKEMSSCAEATFHFKNCDLPRLDGTGNGVPCKALCR